MENFCRFIHKEYSTNDLNATVFEAKDFDYKLDGDTISLRY